MHSVNLSSVVLPSKLSKYNLFLLWSSSSNNCFNIDLHLYGKSSDLWELWSRSYSIWIYLALFNWLFKSTSLAILSVNFSCKLFGLNLSLRTFIECSDNLLSALK